MPTYTLTINEDELYRLRMGLYAKVAEWSRQLSDSPDTVPAIVAKYDALLLRMNSLKPRRKKARG